MSVEPYFSARTVFWIVDNGSSHAGQASIRRLEDAYENLRLIHLPIHASWLNQIELYFSIVQRRALTPNDFDSLDVLTQRLLRFGDHYRQIAQPFEWTFTRADLDRLLARIEAHEPPLALGAQPPNFRTRPLEVCAGYSAGLPQPPTAGTSIRARIYVTERTPFMPAAAWPGTVQMYW